MKSMSKLPDGFDVHRFWSKVKQGPPDLCWEWQASRNNKGYGEIGRLSNELGRQYAHRISWCIHHGEIPPKAWVLHQCDNPACVNPHHLFLGNNSLNQKDCYLKGRSGLLSRRKMEAQQ